MATGMMGTDKAMMDRLRAAGDYSAERVWELPLFEEYSKQIKSDFADIKNVSSGREAGSIIGGAFLKEFVGDTPWVHLDIAGTAWTRENQALHSQRCHWRRHTSPGESPGGYGRECASASGKEEPNRRRQPSRKRQPQRGPPSAACRSASPVGAGTVLLTRDSVPELYGAQALALAPACRCPAR